MQLEFGLSHKIKKKYPYLITLFAMKIGRKKSLKTLSHQLFEIDYHCLCMPNIRRSVCDMHVT